MSKILFWIPFTTGVFHTLATKEKKNPQWAITNSILGITSYFSMLASAREEYFLKPEHKKLISSKSPVPIFLASSFVVSAMHAGTFFCLGHLVSKKAYPVFQSD